jgi:hypothetical protein
VRGAGLHAEAATFDEAFIKQRSRLIGIAIAARKLRFPNEVSYNYAPIAEDAKMPVWNEEVKASLKNYNLMDLSI